MSSRVMLATVLISRSIPQMLVVAELQEAALVHVFFADGINDQASSGTQVGQRVHDGFPHGGRVDDGVRAAQERRRSCHLAQVAPSCRANSRWAGSRANTKMRAVRVLMAGHLQHEMGRSAESRSGRGDRPFGDIRQPQCAESDGAGTQERGGLLDRKTSSGMGTAYAAGTVMNSA